MQAGILTNHHLPFGGVGNSGIGAYHGKIRLKYSVIGRLS